MALVATFFAFVAGFLLGAIASFFLFVAVQAEIDKKRKKDEEQLNAGAKE